MRYVYGHAGRRFSLEADNDLLAIATIVSTHPHNGAFQIYEPNNTPQWVDFLGSSRKKIEKIFEKTGGFNIFMRENSSNIEAVVKTIKSLTNIGWK